MSPRDHSEAEPASSPHGGPPELRRVTRAITVEPDAVAVIAARLARRLRRDGLLPDDVSFKRADAHEARVTDALADELHHDIVDRMLS